MEYWRGYGSYPTEVKPELAKEILSDIYLPAKGVILVLSSDFNEISKIIDIVQPKILHLGASLETLTLAKVKLLKQKYPQIKLMRSIPVTGKESIAAAKEYESVADYLLLDTYEPHDSQIGATGKTHDWKLSKQIIDSVKIPVILAGGLGPNNVVEAINAVKPAGVDSKTKTDRADGSGKDIQKVKEFVRLAKQASSQFISGE